MGPLTKFHGATTERCDYGPDNAWIYRVLRRGETPLDFRTPRAPNLRFDEKRALLLDACALGNDPEQPSPFLHCTKRVACALFLRSERESMYTNWLIRWPLKIEGVEVVDLTERGTGKEYLDDRAGDSGFIQCCLKAVRAFSNKDAEVVVLQRPPEKLIQWWCEIANQWLAVSDLRALASPPPVAAAPPAAASAVSQPAAVWEPLEKKMPSRPQSLTSQRGVPAPPPAAYKVSWLTPKRLPLTNPLRTSPFGRPSPRAAVRVTGGSREPSRRCRLRAGSARRGRRPWSRRPFRPLDCALALVGAPWARRRARRWRSRPRCAVAFLQCLQRRCVHHDWGMCNKLGTSMYR